MMQITIDFQSNKGRIKALNGVNNGPVCYGSLIDVSHYYKELGIPYARLHDTNWPHPREVDIHTVFPDFSADPENPTCYDFECTDSYIASIINTGAKIIYRLGVSIEHTTKKYYTHPPVDSKKWANICIGIIKHYNEGWANGYTYGIKYWEIWNEPDNPDTGCMWTGTTEQYLDLYKAASAAIKAYDPDLKVGGFAATMINPEFTACFLEYCKTNNLPLDFFSWHTYADNPGLFFNNAEEVKKLLDGYGFYHTESHMNEWNYISIDPRDGERLWKQGGELIRQSVFEKAKSAEGASFTATILTGLQDYRVDVANYYDGQPSSMFCGLFDYYGTPKKTYYAFKMFRILLDYPRKLQVNNTTDISCCAGINEESGEAAALMSNFSSAGCYCIIKFLNLPQQMNYHCEYYLLDSNHDFEKVGSQAICNEKCEVNLDVKKYSVILLHLKYV